MTQKKYKIDKEFQEEIEEGIKEVSEFEKNNGYNPIIGKGFKIDFRNFEKVAIND